MSALLHYTNEFDRVEESTIEQDEATYSESFDRCNLGSVLASERCILKHSLCNWSVIHVIFSISAGQNVDACTSLNNLIANSINSNELDCHIRSDCSGIKCFSQNSFLENFADLFDFRLLPCATPSPALWLQVSSKEDPANNNLRTVVWNETLTNSSNTAALEIRGGGNILFGTYQFSANFSEASSSVGFAVSPTIIC